MKKNKTQKTESYTSMPMDTHAGSPVKSFNASWSIMKGIIFVFGLVVLIVVAGALFFAYTSYEASQSRAYIITEMGTVLAKSTKGDIKSREIEVRNHINLFFNKMYAFNEYNFKTNVEEALHLIGPDGKVILSGYNSGDAYQTLVKTSASVSVAVDSIWVDMESKPYRAKAFVRQIFTTPTGSVTKKLWSDMVVRELPDRSAQNIHALLIDQFNVFNGDIIEEK